MPGTVILFVTVSTNLFEGILKIPEFIALVAEGKFEEAYLKIKETSSLPAVCGRVCPQERQCESKCVRGIKGEPVAIGRLERFCADYHMAHGVQVEEKIEKNGPKAAVVGAGLLAMYILGVFDKFARGKAINENDV